MEQTPIPLTHFVDFILTTGPGRVAAVKAFQRPDARLNFYQPVQDAITDAHRRNARVATDNEVLDVVITRSTDAREQRIFPKVVTGYRKFLHRQRTVEWFEPPLRDLELGPCTVRVDPELGLVIDGRPHAIKMYWRGEPPPAPRLALMNALLERALRLTWPGVVFAVMDVRRGRLYPSRVKDIHDVAANLILQPEALCFDAIARAL